MELLRSRFREDHGHPDVVVAFEPGFQDDAVWLLDHLESQIRQGKKFGADSTLRVGWSLVTLMDNGRGALDVWEPKLDQIPIVWTPGIANTFRVLNIQLEVCKQLGADPDFASLQQSGDVSPSFLAQPDAFRMAREQGEGSYSGWSFFEDGDVDPIENLSSLFEVGINRPGTIPFMALPAGASVFATPGGIEISLAGRTISSDDNALLAKLQASSFS